MRVSLPKLASGIAGKVSSDISKYKKVKKKTARASGETTRYTCNVNKRLKQIYSRNSVENSITLVSNTTIAPAARCGNKGNVPPMPGGDNYEQTLIIHYI